MNRVSPLLATVFFAIALLAFAAHGQTPWDQQKATELASSLMTSLADLETVIANDPELGQQGIDGGDMSLSMKVTTMHEQAMGLSDALSKGEGRDATKDRFGDLGEMFDDLQVMVGQMFEQDDLTAGYAKASQLFEQLKAYYGKI